MRLLDLFSGAGGAAVGYSRAGFTSIVGVDIKPQPRYPFEFVQGDALEYLALIGAAAFDVIHASPPCQAYSTLAGRTGKEYPDLVREVRRLLRGTGKVYVIENVVGAPLYDPLQLCGSAFDLGVRRHRLFESNKYLRGSRCQHELQPAPIDVSGTGSAQHCERKKKTGGTSRKPASLAEARRAMGIDWMERRELSQAIPPAYTQFIGIQLRHHIEYLRGEADDAARRINRDVQGEGLQTEDR